MDPVHCPKKANELTHSLIYFDKHDKTLNTVKCLLMFENDQSSIFMINRQSPEAMITDFLIVIYMYVHVVGPWRVTE